MPTFNELLKVNGIDPKGVILLRHSGRGKLGYSPHDLWLRRDGSFERYERTQEYNRPLFRSATYWASFVATPDNSTLFLGLRRSRLAEDQTVDWKCPMTGLRPGEDKGRNVDVYELEDSEALAPHREKLKVGWDNGWVAWARHAYGNDKPIVDDIFEPAFEAFSDSQEGEQLWRTQRSIERDPKVVREAFRINEQNGGYACAACGFRHADRGLFDAHHPNPLLTGPRTTRARDLLILCPTCHRRAHRSSNRFLPFGIAELRGWVAAGRP